MSVPVRCNLTAELFEWLFQNAWHQTTQYCSKFGICIWGAINNTWYLHAENKGSELTYSAGDMPGTSLSYTMFWCEPAPIVLIFGEYSGKSWNMKS